MDQENKYVINLNRSDSSDSDVELLPIDQVNFTGGFDYIDTYLLTGVIKAAYCNDLPSLVKLVEEGRSVNVTDNKGNTPLHIAAQKQGGLEILDYLLSRDETSINAQNFEGETPLYCALNAYPVNDSKSRNQHALKLLDAAADVNIATNFLNTPLHCAIKNRWHNDIALALIEHGANLNAKNGFGNTPLLIAIINEDLEKTSLLLYHGADTSITTKAGLSPFMQSLQADHSLQELLIEYETDFNRETRRGFTPLFQALAFRSSLVGEIIKRGADISYVTLQYNALKLALDAGNVEMFKYIFTNTDYEEIWNCKQSVLSVLLTTGNENLKSKEEMLKFVIESDKIETVVKSVQSYESVIILIIDSFPYRISENMIFILLSYGLEIHDVDVNMLYENHGLCPLFYLFVNMSCIKTRKGYTSCIFPLIYYTMNKSIKELFVDAILFDRVPRFTDLKSVREYFVNAKYFEEFLNFAACLNLEVEDFLKEDVPCAMPSLLELCRNTLRDLIAANCNNKSSMYYAFVKSLQLPESVKKILEFRTPIYH